MQNKAENKPKHNIPCNAPSYPMIRIEIENIIKEFHLDRSRIFEVSHLKYADIIKQIERTFVKNAGPLHWSNIDYRFNPALTINTQYIGNHRRWYQLLHKIIPDTAHYVLFEDTINFQPKYWVYEMFPNEIITVIDECCGLNDFYIVSKKYKWLISECHEEIAYFVGDGINISLTQKCNSQIELLTEQIKEKEGITQPLEGTDFQEWAHQVNEINWRAEEIVLAQYLK